MLPCAGAIPYRPLPTARRRPRDGPGQVKHLRSAAYHSFGHLFKLRQAAIGDQRIGHAFRILRRFLEDDESHFHGIAAKADIVGLAGFRRILDVPRRQQHRQHQRERKPLRPGLAHAAPVG